MQTLRRLIDPDLIRQARLFESMTDSLRKCLAADSALHCWVGGIRDQTLVVVTDRSAHATLVHYQQREILKRINSDFRPELPAPLTRLKLKIRQMPVVATKNAQRPALSAENARRLASTATAISDAGVRSALNRLARRGGKS